MKFILGIILLSVSVFAQDKPAELPEKVELTVEQTKQVKDAQGKLETANLRAENLALKIQQAQEDLKKLQEAAQKEQQGFAAFFAGLVKIPSDKLVGYTIEEKDGKIILTKKKE